MTDLLFPEIEITALKKKEHRVALESLREFVTENPGKSINYSRICRSAEERLDRIVGVSSLKSWLRSAGVDLAKLPTSKGAQAAGGTPIVLLDTCYSKTPEYRRVAQREFYEKRVKSLSGKDIRPQPHRRKS
jgi:hypothetical protein